MTAEHLMHVLMTFLILWFIKDIITLVYLRRHPDVIEQPKTHSYVGDALLDDLAAIKDANGIKLVREAAKMNVQISRVVLDETIETKKCIEKRLVNRAFLGFFNHPQFHEICGALSECEETIDAASMNIFAAEWVLRMTEVDENDPYKAYAKVTSNILGNLIVLKNLVKDRPKSLQ